MNRYGTMAQEHWKRFRPHSYQQIPDPHSFFDQMGRDVENEIAELAEALAGDDPPEEDYLGKAGRLNAARHQAEEKVLAERVLLPAEPGTEMDETESDMPLTRNSTQDGWIPTSEGPTHPFWQNNPTE